MAEGSDHGDRAAKHAPSSTPIWRTVFDAVERPVTRSSEAWVQGNGFMDGLALAWRLERRLDRQVRHGLDMWLGALRLASRGDVDRLAGEMARVERELRELRRALERAGAAGSEPGVETAGGKSGAGAAGRGRNASVRQRAPRRGKR